MHAEASYRNSDSSATLCFFITGDVWVSEGIWFLSVSIFPPTFIVSEFGRQNHRYTGDPYCVKALAVMG